MKFSEMWLREWVNPPISNIELINQLSMAGFKVNESKPIYTSFFSGVVIGEIVECKMHPKSFNTWIIKVNNGTQKLLNIVCSAVNCRKNLRVVVANTGTLLPNGCTVKKNIIQEQLSEGILCSFPILGLKVIDHTENIIELPIDAPIGQEFYDYLRLNDNIIDINITPNRGDCLNILGIAREIAAINHLKLKKLKINTISPTIYDTIPIMVENNEACPQFLGKILKNIDIIVPTPLWIKEKLRRCGICSINVVEDIANYVLLELGYPIHIFDYDKIDGKAIYVRFAKIGEMLKLSDNHRNLTLFPNTLITADCKKPLSIAGIIIGNQSDVSLKTHNIILQSAFFNPSIIIGQSRIYNIQTLSSIRYERGIDPNISNLALNRVVSLLLEICGGYSGPTMSIINSKALSKPTTITLRRIKLDKILGFHILDQEVKYILKSLGFKIESLNNAWKILTPSWRPDISLEENLIAEIIRIHGYNKIPRTCMINNTHSKIVKSHTHSTVPLSRIKNLLIDRGYQEVITYSFVNPNIQKLLYPQKIPLTIINPITLEMSVMRLSLWIGLLEAMIFNQNRQQKNISLFESGICFIPENSGNNQICQNFMISGIRSGFRFNEHWDLIKYPVDFYDIKGDVEALLHITNHLNSVKFKKYIHPALHPGQSAEIYLNDRSIGYIGMIHPSIQMQLHLRSQVLVFELEWNALSKYILPQITNISKFPKNYRDISVILSDTISAESVISECKKIAKDELIEVKLSDVYKNQNISKGFKSFTIKLFLQSKTHTLKEEEISNIVNQCILILKKRFQATIRQ